MAEPAEKDDPEEREAAGGWLSAKERGGVLAIRLTVFLTTFLGRPITRFIALFVTLYYTLTSPTARAAIRTFRGRLLAAERGPEGAPEAGDETSASFWEVYRHMLRFVRCTLDAFFLVSGKTAPFKVTRTGHEHLAGLRDRGEGAILLGAHLGSFYAMRIQSSAERIPLYALMYTANARMLNDALAKLDPQGAARILDLDPEGGMRTMLRARELLEEGALLAIMGDRIPASTAPERVIWAPFLGAEAPFPAGPFLMAALLKCPVYLTFGLARDPDTYDLYCEPFAERIVLPRGDRQGALEGYVRRYAESLERYVKKAPDNWFNFYDFWAPPPGSGPPPGPPSRSQPGPEPEPGARG